MSTCLCVCVHVCLCVLQVVSRVEKGVGKERKAEGLYFKNNLAFHVLDLKN